ncbi:MAG TPA: prolyl oligopeptidase family serine peptidase [Acidimicrobiia bacterium]|nr:prolyl oligopeptidase family serine peptidase [Acidimicrobiia bacterium]
MPFTYPAARRADVVDDYHGTGVPDPYRWLEDPDDPETQAFVAAQNAITRPYLDGLSEVTAFRTRMTEIWDTPRTGAPQHRGEVTVWQHNDGLLDQAVFLVARRDAEPRPLLDPNTLSSDGAVAVTAWSLSPDGALMAYTVSEAGSDQQVARVLDTATGEHLDDELHELRFTNLSWWGDGFFYSRFPGLEPGTTGTFENMSVFHHRIGTDQSADPLVFANPERPDLGYDAVVSDDERYLVLHEFEGTSHHMGLLFKPLDDPDAEFVRVAQPGVAVHAFVAHHDGHILVHTDLDAPNGRIVAIPVEDDAARIEVVAEGDRPIEAAAAAAGRIVLITLEEASHRIALHTFDGEPAEAIELPAPGTVVELTGRLSDPVVHVGFQSFNHPPSVIRWEDGETRSFAEPTYAVDPDHFTVERHHAASTDGAAVGMFVVRHRSTTLPAPTELYGYGGFNISSTPMYSPARLAWLEAGGVVVVANLRGGAEHGDEWHRQGMLGRKQQVFDDFIACAEHLIDAGITTTPQLAVRGRSNGGLLTAATMVQRPDLFGAVISQVPVTDMFRYQHFTAGRYWTVEYGDAGTDPEAFAWLSKYSPIHNVQPEVEYPPTLILTAETDDRVVPMHAHKFAAELQQAAGGSSEQPLLERVDTRAGHGLGKPTSKVIEEEADVYGFLLHHLR